MRHSVIGAMALMLLCFAAQSLSAESLTSSENCADSAWGRVVVELEAIRQRANVAGLALIVVDHRRTQCAAYLGLADRQSSRSVDAATYFRVGSISKSFTALAALRLAEAGKLDLDAPLASLLAEHAPANRWAEHHPLTAGQLLQHSAGLPDMSTAEFDYANEGALSLSQALAIAPQSRRIRWPPGMHTSYSNSGAGLVALAMERNSGQRFEQYMREQVFLPLGMESASFERTAQVERTLATGYNRDGTTVIPYWHIIYRPAGGMNVLPSQMVPFLQMLLNRGRHGDAQFLDPASVELLQDPSDTLAARSGLKFGRGLGNYHYQYRARSFHGHGGDADGYLAHYGYNEDSGLGYFLVINAFQGGTLRRMRNLVEAQIISGLQTPRYPPELSLAEEYLAEISGEYQAVTYRFSESAERLDLEVDEGRLYSRVPGEAREELIAVNEQHWRRPWQSVATIALLNDEQGWVLQGEMGNYRKAVEPSAQ